MEDGDSFGDMFAEPENYYPPTPPGSIESYTLATGQALTLHLVGYTPFEAHHLWNGARIVSRLFESEPWRVRDKTVLEIGAASGLPSLVCGALGSKRVMVTDFPDIDLIQNMQKNVDGLEESVEGTEGRVRVKGYTWGADVSPLIEEMGSEWNGGFDVLILADLLFKHSEHPNLVKTIRRTLSRRRASCAYVVFTSYRPWLQHKDLEFFDVAREDGFVVEKILEERLEKPMFEGDPGDLEIQKTVTGWTVRWPEDECEG
ncbi:hypothetical protein VUR80DRAFT_8358 [Thermomyces stellatus]